MTRHVSKLQEQAEPDLSGSVGRVGVDPALTALNRLGTELGSGQKQAPGVVTDAALKTLIEDLGGGSIARARKLASGATEPETDTEREALERFMYPAPSNTPSPEPVAATSAPVNVAAAATMDVETVSPNPEPLGTVP